MVSKRRVKIISVKRKETLQDGKTLKVPGGVNPSFTEVNATTELLLNANLLKCIKDTDKCIAPGASVTDFNIWGKSTPVEDMVEWTECRLSKLDKHFETRFAPKRPAAHISF